MDHSLKLNPRLSRRNALKLAGTAATTSIVFPRGTGAQDATPAADLGYFPSPLDGVPDAWYVYPEPYTSVPTPPGKGGTVKLGFISEKAIADHSSNAYWQGLEERLGVQLDLTLFPWTAYAERMATMIAGGDFPDLLQGMSLAYAQLNEFKIQGAFTPLTDYLSPEARQNYPNLAKFPSLSFDNSKLNGVAYGVPSPISLQPNAMWYRSDWLEKKGLTVPTNGAEFRNLLDVFTNGDPDGNGSHDTFGTTFEYLDAISQRFVGSMFRVGVEGNGWIVKEDGSFVHAIETPEFAGALEYGRDIWQAGFCHPDSITQTSENLRQQLMAGQAGTGPNAFILLNFMRSEAKKLNPDAQFLGLVPPGHDGGEGVAYNVGGWFGEFLIPSPNNPSEERIEELIGITNYFGAPFGSEEYIFLNFGLEGVHHEVHDDGSRVLTTEGERDVIGPHLGGLNILYSPDKEEIRYIQELMAAQTRIGRNSVTASLWAPTATEKGGELTQLYLDMKTDIGTGRAGLDTLQDFIDEYMARGGNEIRREYEEAYAAAQGN